MRVPRGLTRRTALRAPRGNLANPAEASDSKVGAARRRQSVRSGRHRQSSNGDVPHRLGPRWRAPLPLCGPFLVVRDTSGLARDAYRIRAIDGTLAIEFGQKSHLGGILNESGDVVSDVALFLPLALVSPFSAASITVLIFLAAMSEFVGMAGTMLSSTRRLEGPLGKVDRSIVLALVAIAIAACGRLPEGVWFVVPALCLGLVVTIWNRLRFALVERGAQTEQFYGF
jgi:CDP-diacylglycerol---glycerol-3-phosphate 3-phosphatidyltransferase